jgi:hypothetical protein
VKLPVPSERTVRVLGALSLVGDIVFLWWLVTLAAAGTGADLPAPQIVVDYPTGEAHPAVVVWRLVNVTLTAGVALALWMRWFDCRTSRDPFLKAGEMVLVSAVLVGTLHLLLISGPLTLAMPIITLSCLLTLIGLWRTRPM